MGLLSFIGNIGSKLIGGFADKASDRVLDKVTGVPTPRESVSGAEAGANQRDFLQNAYPGTTPWEQLGASGSYGGSIGPETSARIQEKLQKSELENRTDIAKLNARAGVISSSAGLGPKGVKSNLSALEGATKGEEYDTKVKQDRERIQSELENLGADTNKKVQEAAVNKARAIVENNQGKISAADAEIADALSDAKLNQSEFGSVTSMIGTLVKGIVETERSVRSQRNEFIGKMLGRGKKPARFYK